MSLDVLLSDLISYRSLSDGSFSCRYPHLECKPYLYILSLPKKPMAATYLTLVSSIFAPRGSGRTINGVDKYLPTVRVPSPETLPKAMLPLRSLDRTARSHRAMGDLAQRAAWLQEIVIPKILPVCRCRRKLVLSAIVQREGGQGQGVYKQEP